LLISKSAAIAEEYDLIKELEMLSKEELIRLVKHFELTSKYGLM